MNLIKKTALFLVVLIAIVAFKKVEKLALNERTKSNQFERKIINPVDRTIINSSKQIISLQDSTVLPDSIKALISKHLDSKKLLYDKVFYLNFLNYIFKYDEYLTYENDSILKFIDLDYTLSFCQNNLKLKKLNNVFYTRIDYKSLGHYSRGRDFVIFDAKGNIKSHFDHWEGNHDRGDKDHKEEIRDWNGDGKDEVIVNFYDARRFYKAKVEYVFSYDEEKDSMKRIFVFDRMFTGSEEPKYDEECGVKGYQPIDFRDTAYYKFISADSILAHFQYSRINTKTKRKKIEEEYDFWITRQKEGFYLNPNNTVDFWLKRRANNEIFYNPYCETCDKQQMPYVTVTYPDYYKTLPAKWKKKKYFK